jgi:hypothetical protein
MEYEMRVTLDGTQCKDLDAATIGEAIELGCAQAHELGRIVVQIEADQRTLEAAELGDQSITDGTADVVALTSLEPREVLLASLDLGSNAVLAANEQFALAARSLQGGDAQEATAPLQEGLELWQALDEHVLREAVPTIIESVEDGPSMEEFTGLVQELEKALDSIRQAIGNGDTSALSDSLLYEFPDTAQRWTDFFAKCTDALAGNDNTEARQ